MLTGFETSREERIELALHAFKSNQGTQRKIALHYDLPELTLRYRLNGRKSAKAKSADEMLCSAGEEKMLKLDHRFELTIEDTV